MYLRVEDMSIKTPYLSRRNDIKRYALNHNGTNFPEIKFQKVEILAVILNHMGEPLESNYFSSGSTVTRAGLQKMCQTICDVEDVSKFSKKTCLEVILQHFGDTNGMQGYFLSPGSTVTRKALMRIYYHILKN